jgi:integrase
LGAGAQFRRIGLADGDGACHLNAIDHQRPAVQDERGLYYAFPFLTGVRPSEQLALLWEDVDLEARLIRIRRTQEPGGSITELTKTSASTRDIPITPLLGAMLVRWRTACPRANGYEYRVFPLLGRPGSVRTKKSGRPLCYTNFLYTYWRPALNALQLPIVTPHSARHAFISTLQAKGIEIGLVAKLAGHSNATVTLSHYTQAVRGGEAALRALEDAYGNGRGVAPACTMTTPPA